MMTVLAGPGPDSPLNLQCIVNIDDILLYDCISKDGTLVVTSTVYSCNIAVVYHISGNENILATSNFQTIQEMAEDIIDNGQILTPSGVQGVYEVVHGGPVADMFEDVAYEGDIPGCQVNAAHRRISEEAILEDGPKATRSTIDCCDPTGIAPRQGSQC